MENVIVSTAAIFVFLLNACSRVEERDDIASLKSVVIEKGGVAAVNEDSWVEKNRRDTAILLLTFNYKDWLASNGDLESYRIEGFNRIREDDSIMQVKIHNLADMFDIKLAIKEKVLGLSKKIDEAILFQRENQSGVIRCFFVVSGEELYLIAVSIKY
jgi:hypothetical protein